MAAGGSPPLPFASLSDLWKIENIVQSMYSSVRKQALTRHLPENIYNVAIVRDAQVACIEKEVEPDVL